MVTDQMVGLVFWFFPYSHIFSQYKLSAVETLLISARQRLEHSSSREVHYSSRDKAMAVSPMHGSAVGSAFPQGDCSRFFFCRRNWGREHLFLFTSGWSQGAGEGDLSPFP